MSKERENVKERKRGDLTSVNVLESVDRSSAFGIVFYAQVVLRKKCRDVVHT